MSALCKKYMATVYQSLYNKYIVSATIGQSEWSIPKSRVIKLNTRPTNFISPPCWLEMTCLLISLVTGDVIVMRWKQN